MTNPSRPAAGDAPTVCDHLYELCRPDALPAARAARDAEAAAADRARALEPTSRIEGCTFTPSAATFPLIKITVIKDGPYHVTGSVPLAVQTIVAHEVGNSVRWKQGEQLQTPEEYFLCRCGQSSTKPFCDGSHARVGFDGSETASRLPYVEQASEQDGPIVGLSDAPPLCAVARFCDVGGQVWNLVEVADVKAAALAVREAELCPSGRLVAWDRRTGRMFEPELEPSIGIVEDPAEGVSGPLWVRGGIPVQAADGTEYETRNRVTLCRCGASRNKPFCDGTHAAIGFRDSD